MRTNRVPHPPVPNPKSNGDDVEYSDICYKPLGNFNTTNPGEDCATLSIFQWLDNDRDALNSPTSYITV